MKLKDKITQGMLEDYESAIIDLKPSMGLAHWRGESARAAHAAGWFEGDCDLDDPHEIAKMSDLAKDRYNELVRLSPHGDGGGEPRPEPEGTSAAD